MERLLGVDRRRELPEFERETLVDWFDRRSGTTVDEAAAERRVVLYPDVYTNHVQVDRGKAAVRVLEALGVAVEVPKLPGSGRAPLSQGMIATAETKAEAVHAGLEPYLESEYDVVVVEPSDLAMFRRDYEKLLDADAFESLSAASYEVFEYVYGLLENGADPSALSESDAGAAPGDADERVAYHSHCQQRTLGLAVYTEAVLDRLGYDVVTSDVECCGMAGSFGYKSEYYELSLAVGDRLREQFTGAETADRTVVASGTSCHEQLDSMIDRPAAHPIRLLDPDR